MTITLMLAAVLLASELAAARTGRVTHPVYLDVNDWSRFAWGAAGWSAADIEACDALTLNMEQCVPGAGGGTGSGTGAGNGTGGGKNKP